MFKKMKPKISQFATGWIADRYDFRDWHWDDIFSSLTPGSEELPDEFSWKEKLPTEIPIQKNIPSCCSCSFSFLQAFNSKQEGYGADFLASWRFIWANLSSKTPVGSTFRDNAKVVQELGVSREAYCPSSPEKGYDWVSDKNNLTQKSYDDALRYRIKNYSYVNAPDLKRAIYRQPVIVAVYGNNQCWQDFSKPIEYCGWEKAEWTHAICIYGWDKDGNWEFVNWWGKDKTFGKLKTGYPFAAMLSVEDLPDIEPVIIKDTSSIRLVRTVLAPAVYLLCNEILHPIKDETTFKEYFGDWKLVEVINQSELDKYKIGIKIISLSTIKELFNT